MKKIFALGPIAGVGLAAFLGGAAFAQDDEIDQIELGRQLYDGEVGTMGCAMCHGQSGAGDPQLGGPFIRGASQAQIDSALNGAVPVMEFLDLSAEQQNAVHAYLSYVVRAEESQFDPRALAGKRIFEETAGGVGCASCHGDDAGGDLAPEIRGVDSGLIFEQLAENPEMSFIELSEDEVNQVAAYMRFLHDMEDH